LYFRDTTLEIFPENWGETGRIQFRKTFRLFEWISVKKKKG